MNLWKINLDNVDKYHKKFINENLTGLKIKFCFNFLKLFSKSCYWIYNHKIYYTVT